MVEQEAPDGPASLDTVNPMPRRPGLSLAERAAMTRQVADEHRAIATDTLRIADDLDHKADLMERGIDPYAADTADGKAGDE